MHHIIIILLFFHFSLSAQTYHALSGRILDEQSTELVGATVLLLTLPDSTMEEYALTNEKGIFKISAVPNANYLLQISYMGYETHCQSIDLNKKIELRDMVLKEKKNLLESVEVTEAEKTLNLWIVADNLRKGAATNAVQIAERLLMC